MSPNSISLSSSSSEMTVTVSLEAAVLMVVLGEEPVAGDEVEEELLVEGFIELAVLPLLEGVVKLWPGVLLVELDRGIGLSNFRARRRLINWSLDSRRARGMHTGSYTMRPKVPPVKI